MKWYEVILYPGQIINMDGGIGVVKSVQWIKNNSMVSYQRAFVEWVQRKENDPKVVSEEARSSYFGFDQLEER